jgi:hypothetical protein
MAKHKRAKRIYEYTCSISGEVFKTEKEAPRPKDLMSVKAYYEIHPENDDRPEKIKSHLQDLEEAQKKKQELLDSLKG